MATNQLGHFVLHLHGCCLHEYPNDDLHAVLLNGQYSGQDSAGRWILLLLHPRWCAECIRERSHAIAIGYEQRLRELELSSAHVEQVRTEIAYLEGVRDGRVEGLSVSFAELPGWDELEGVGGEGVDEVVEMLGEVEVGPRAAGDVERDEELAAMMGKESLGGDELEEEFEQCFNEEVAYQKGFEEGRKEQSENEWVGLHETDWDTRKYLLEMALA
jgi:hypothetical protein